VQQKINQKNAFSLDLIEHIDDVLETQEQQSTDPDCNTNFQAASYTLDASVKIYSCRVDAVHNEAYRVLGGLSRTSQADNDDEVLLSPTTSRLLQLILPRMPRRKPPAREKGKQGV